MLLAANCDPEGKQKLRQQSQAASVIPEGIQNSAHSKCVLSHVATADDEPLIPKKDFADGYCDSPEGRGTQNSACRDHTSSYMRFPEGNPKLC
jgi:hypothetical protein